MRLQTIRFLLCALLLGSLTTGKGQIVWPGDVNNNGIVNAVDLMYVGYAHGAFGPSRLMQSTDWEPQFLPVPWAQDFPDGVNFAYADCNGDGLIDIQDLLTIYLNFGLTHGQVTADVFPIGIANIDPHLTMEPHTSKNPYYPGDTVRMDLVLGASNMPLQDVFGISFILDFDLVDRDAIRFRLDSSWMNPGGDPVITVFNDLGAQQVAVNVQKFGNQTPSQGGGSIGTLEIIIEENLVGVAPNDTAVLGLCFENVLLMDSSFNPIPVFTPCFETGVTETLTAIEEPLQQEAGYRLYPNPATQQVWLESTYGGHKGDRIELVNSQGQVVKTMEFTEGKMAIPLSGMQTGLYLVKIYQKKRAATQLPLIIQD